MFKQKTFFFRKEIDINNRFEEIKKHQNYEYYVQIKNTTSDIVIKIPNEADETLGNAMLHVNVYVPPEPAELQSAELQHDIDLM